MLAPLLALGLTVLTLAFSFSLLTLGLALRCFHATLAALWSSLGLEVFDSVAHISEKSHLFSDGWWFARNLGPLWSHLVVETMADFVLNHLPLIGRQPHEAGDFINEIIDTVFVPQAILFANRLDSRDALAERCSEGGFKAFPLGVLWV